jgi:hypothetical protein
MPGLFAYGLTRCVCNTARPVGVLTSGCACALTSRMSTCLSAACYLVPLDSCLFHNGILHGQQVAFASQERWEAEHMPACTVGNVCNYTPLIWTALQTNLMYMIQLAMMPSMKALLPFSFSDIYMAKLYFLLFKRKILCSILSPSAPCSLYRFMPDHPVIVVHYA